MINIAIVEDDDSFASTISAYLDRYGRESGEQLKYTRYTDGYAIVSGYRCDYNIILMDIEMGLMDGMEAATEIRRVDDDVTIIFITNMAQYAIKGYAVHALDYVLKPVSYPAFAESIKKAIVRIDRQEKRFITVNYKDGRIKLPAADINYVESHGHRLTFHTDSEDYETTVYTMKEVEDKLADSGFMRSSSGVLVNLGKVTSTQNGCVVVAGRQLPVSRGKKNEFMAALVSHMVD